MPTLPISDRSQLSYLTPVSNLQSPCLCGFSKFFWRQDVKQTGQEMSLVLRPLLCLGYIGEVSGGYKQCTVFPCKWGSVRTEDTDKLPLSTYNHHLGGKLIKEYTSFVKTGKIRNMSRLLITFPCIDICCCCCSVAKSYPTLCDPMGFSVLGFSVHYLLEFAQIRVHWVGDAI